MKTHWTNPWTEAVPVPIQELAECVYGLGKEGLDSSGMSFIPSKEFMLSIWRSSGDKLDAYILPKKQWFAGLPAIGIRYGNEGYEYLSPLGDRSKVESLLNKYQSISE
jgi:hypothetical protein